MSTIIPNEYSFGISLLQNHAQSKSFFHGIETNEQLGHESEKVKQELLEVEPDILEMNDDPVLDGPVLDEMPIKNEILDDNEIKKEDPLDDEEYYMNPGYLALRVYVQNFSFTVLLVYNTSWVGSLKSGKIVNVYVIKLQMIRWVGGQTSVKNCKIVNAPKDLYIGTFQDVLKNVLPLFSPLGSYLPLVRVFH